MQDMQTPISETPLSIGTIVQERYIVERLLGRGVSGAVYVIRDLRGEQPMLVLKEAINLNRRTLSRFLLECESLVRLQHPALPAIYYALHDEKHTRAYILMDYIEGPNLQLQQPQQPEQRFPLPRAIAIMLPIIDAVIYLHSQQPPIIHKDISPVNIIMSEVRDIPVLVDFDIARKYAVSTGNAHAVQRALTAYELPEQYVEETSTASDIYALGATFYTLLTGMFPLDFLSRKTKQEQTGIDPLKPVNQVVPSISQQAADAISRAMSLSSEERFSTVEEFKQALQVDPEQQFLSESLTEPLPLIDQQEPMPEIALPALVEHQPAVSDVVPATPDTAGKLEAVRFLAPFIPKQLDGRYSREFIRLVFVILALILCIAALIWSYTGASPRPTTTDPIPRATPAFNANQVVEATLIASTTASAIIVEPYDGAIYNIPAALGTKMSLTSIQENNGTISGHFIGLHLQGSFKGKINNSGHIQFTVIDQADHITLSFTGMMQFDGNLAGNYCSLDQNSQCAAEYGVWSVAPGD